MTAIAKTYLKSFGFLMAADGRVTDVAANTVPTDEQQKIFSCKNTNTQLAVGFAGCCQLTSRTDNEILFDGIQETLRLVDRINQNTTVDIRDSLEELADAVSKALNAANTQNGRLDFPTTDPIWVMHFCGFHHQTPCWGRVEFRHQTGRVGEPSVFVDPLRERTIEGDFWEPLSKLIDTDPCFRQYRPHRLDTVEDWSNRLHLLIKAHGDPVALELYGDLCRTIGGKIHIAQVTATDGFRWVPNYEPV